MLYLQVRGHLLYAGIAAQYISLFFVVSCWIHWLCYCCAVWLLCGDN